MHGVLGGFRNMLRTWRNNLRRKKLQKEKELQQEQQKITKFPRLQSFLYSTLAIIYWPIGTILFSKSKVEKVKTEEPKLFKQIQEINLKLDKIIVKDNKRQVEKDLVKIEKQIKKIKQEIQKPMSIDSQQYFQEKTSEIKEKIQYLKLPKSQRKKVMVVPKIQEKKQEPKKEVLKKESVTLQPKQFKAPSMLVEKELPIDNRVEYIKKTNKELKEIEEKVKEITMKVNSTTVYNNFYVLENKLRELAKKIDFIKQQYKELKIDTVEEIYLFDKKELAKSPKEIGVLIEKVTGTLKLIDIKKEEIFYQKSQKEKHEEIAVKKSEEKKNKEKKEVKQMDEALYAQELLLQNIVNQNNLFEDYMQKLNRSKNKKRTLFSSLFSFSKNVVNFSISLLPFSFFKNKIIGTFLSTIMINNSIKTMRKMANPELEINYEIFDKAYFEGKNLIESSYYMCENSLNELAILKDELLLLGVEKESIMLLKQLEQLEYNIERQKQKLNYKKTKLDKVYTKLKKVE